MDIRYVVSIVLFLVEGLWKIIRSGGSFEAIEDQFHRLSQQALTMLFAWMLEKIDEQILKTRDKSRYKCLRLEERTGITIFGEFTVKRRLYKDLLTGKDHFLLDEALGWKPRERLSPKMQRIALDLATETTFRKASRIIGRLVPGISAMTLWHVAKKAGEAARIKGEAARREVYDDGVIPEGKHEAGILFLEADGVMVNQQKSQNQKAEVKLLTAYDGKKSLGPDRRALRHRYSVASTRDAESFWEESSARLAGQWKLDEIERVELGGDGASWVKQGSDIFPNTVYHLDQFHLAKSLTQALSFSSAFYRAAVTAIEQKDRQALIDVLDRAAKQCSRARKRRIQGLKGYLMDNWDGITAQIPECGLGVIEGQVRHTITRRMKRIGARWSPDGTDRMARLLAAKANDELDSCLDSLPAQSNILAEAAGEAPIKRSRACGVEDIQRWLRAHVPALDTPYLTGHLLRQILKEVGDVA